MINLEHLVYHNTGDPEPGQLTLMRPFGPALGHTKAQVATSKRVLRDLPVEAKSHLDALSNTDDISAYVPNALK